MGLEDIAAKVTEAAQGAVGQATGIAQGTKERVTEVAQDAATRAVDVATGAKRQIDLAKYRPVMPEDLESPEWLMPKMVVIDDSEGRQDVEVCKGAIGWLEKQGDMDVFYLYEEEINNSGMNFFPWAAYGSVYLFDNFDKTKYINLGGYFDIVNEEKIVELQSVARLLGAKHIKIEAYYMDKEVSVAKAKGGIKAKKNGANVGVSADAAVKSSKEKEKELALNLDFEDGGQPIRPELKWYASDPKIKELIASRFSEEGLTPLKSYKFEISESSSAMMFQSVAGKVDGALKKMGASFNFSFEGDVQTQSRRRLLLDVQF